MLQEISDLVAGKYIVSMVKGAMYMLLLDGSRGEIVYYTRNIKKLQKAKECCHDLPGDYSKLLRPRAGKSTNRLPSTVEAHGGILSSGKSTKRVLPAKIEDNRDVSAGTGFVH